jgi:hypothetical protein
MKSWLKALFISVVILAGCILYLPYLAKQGINSLLPWAMEQADLEQSHANISQLTWYELQINDVAFFLPSHNSQINSHNIHVSFSPWGLVSGKIENIAIESVKVELLPNDSDVNTSSSKQKIDLNGNSSRNSTNNSTTASTAFELTSLEQLFNRLPIDSLRIKQFELAHPQGNINTEISFNKKQLNINNTLTTDYLTQKITHQFSINNLGDISSLIFVDQQPIPIFNLQANWRVSSDDDAKNITLNLQQSADIQSWLDLIKQQDKAQKVNANVAIQAANIELTLPSIIQSQRQLLSQLSATGLLQIKVENFNIFDPIKKEHIIENADLAINLNTDIDNKREEQWQFSLDTFDLSGEINTLAPIDLKIKQTLEKAISLTCAFKQESSQCNWQGQLAQQLSGEKLKHKTELALDGQFSSHINRANEFISQQVLNLSTQQKNPLWPKASNETQGEIIIQGQRNNDNWHWQLSLPHGLNSQSQYLATLFADKPEAQLSAVNWQLLPDWFIEGIDGELTQAKEFSIIIDQLNWQHKKESLILDNAQVSCSLDWLKLQYSPQLRSQQGLSQLPLACHWKIENQASQWNQWPVPSLSFNGKIDLSSLDLSQAKLSTSMSLSGLADSLDLTLLAQHDFNNLQQGSAQLYLKNLKLDWQKIGLLEMAELTQAQLLDGSISAQGWVQWQQYQADIFDDSSITWRWQPDLMLRIDDMSGVYQQVTTWEDIDVQLAIRRPFYTDFRIDSQVSALSINPGINIANVLARSTTTIKSDLSQALIVIEEVHSDVLGGRINVPLIRFDSSQDVNAFGIEIEGLKLEQLAALEAGSGITATGRLDGVLPIILLPEGPQVPAGSLYARSPGGIVQYQGATAESLKQSDPTVGLAMQVLSDFRYDKLQTNVTYQPDGELKLGLQFQGHNPTFFDGQATHFNLNLDYNLLDLLESLRISNDIVQKLENKYQ